MMGGPCRGIIPVTFLILFISQLVYLSRPIATNVKNDHFLQPFIEEFNYSMPEKCADGNTNVFVNGREFHQRDLDLLSSRGLPTDIDRSYVIEISGGVLDEDSGQELECFGKLAPT